MPKVKGVHFMSENARFKTAEEAGKVKR